MPVYMQVYYSSTEKKDIIHFYNDIYIKAMKEYIIAMKPAQSGVTQSLNMPPTLASRTPIINKNVALLTP
jgi:hypothetical protein